MASARKSATLSAGAPLRAPKGFDRLGSGEQQVALDQVGQPVIRMLAKQGSVSCNARCSGDCLQFP
jgi:hypothetical protein